MSTALHKINVLNEEPASTSKINFTLYTSKKKIISETQTNSIHCCHSIEHGHINSLTRTSHQPIQELYDGNKRNKKKKKFQILTFTYNKVRGHYLLYTTPTHQRRK